MPVLLRSITRAQTKAMPTGTSSVLEIRPGGSAVGKERLLNPPPAAETAFWTLLLSRWDRFKPLRSEDLFLYFFKP